MTLLHSLVGHQAAVDRVRDASAQGLDRLGLGVAGRCPPLHVRDGRRVVLELGDGYPVKGDVDLAIAASVESMAVVVAGPDGDGSGAVMQTSGADHQLTGQSMASRWRRLAMTQDLDRPGPSALAERPCASLPTRDARSCLR